MARRAVVIYTFFIIYFIFIVIRLFLLQVTSNDYLGGLAEKQRYSNLTISAQRGRIFASDNSPLVINQKVFGVNAEPKKIKDKSSVTNLLAKELDIDKASISARLKDESLLWVPIAHKVQEDKVEKLRQNNLTGLAFTEESKRFYPEASMAAHLLGFVGSDIKGEDQGYFGLEGFYNELLRGRDGRIYQETDANGNPILSGQREIIPAENGRDLYLYIDKTIQFIVENNLRRGIEKYGAKGGTVIVMDPFTGGILAMASFPSYDPNRLGLYPSENYKNPAISLSFEPGSTFKVLVMAAAINEGKVTAQTKYNEDGPIKIGEYSINTWNQKYHGEITLTQILEYSSNVGMVFVMDKLEKDNIFTYLDRFSFGKNTNVDLQDEASPIIRPKNKWYEIDYATASFGQGIAVTPLQMVRAVSSIANGGKLMIPQIVKSIKLPSQEIVLVKPKVERIVLKPEAARVVAEMMVSAVDNGETRLIKPPGYRIAGKTGTAQISIAGHYDAEKTIASFVGFAPIEKPKYVMLVSLREPSASVWGSETAAPLFFSISKEIFSYLGISPSD